MKYILDFDRVIFDPDAFVEDAKKQGFGDRHIHPDIWNMFDPRTYFYPDAQAFLESHDPALITILSAMSPELGPHACDFQKQKLSRSGLEQLYTVVVVEGLKGPHAAKLFDGTPTLFADDKLQQLRSVREYCPQISLVQVVRTQGTTADPSVEGIVRIASLQELDTVMSIV